MLRRAAAAVLLLAGLSTGNVQAATSHATTDELGRTTHTVYGGQTLGRIAKRYNVTVEALCHANGLRYGARIHPGQRLVIPNGNDEALPVGRAGRGNHWQDYAETPRKRGVVTLQTSSSKWHGRVLTRRGRVLPGARGAVEKMLASWRTGTEHEIDPRLIQLIVRVSDTFGGRPVRVVSGYREHSFFEESKHKVGHAFDFSIPGVPNAALRDYLRTLPNVGVGYYPNSTHVHLDVRDASAYWVDEAGPGEAPRLANRDGAKPPPADDDASEPPPPPVQATTPELSVQ